MLEAWAGSSSTRRSRDRGRRPRARAQAAERVRERPARHLQDDRKGAVHGEHPPIAPSRMKWRVSRSMPQAECMTPIVWPSGSVKSPMTRPSMTSSGPIMRVPPRLSACASEASTSGTST